MAHSRQLHTGKLSLWWRTVISVLCGAVGGLLMYPIQAIDKCPKFDPDTGSRIDFCDFPRVSISGIIGFEYLWLFAALLVAVVVFLLLRLVRERR
ncbi:hypothetical protein [Psychromicrobium lacuslunae]|uniref:Uncharacterized protein n=1 Tax=Psychromicrobium lacuslunae TaxID=1618207 RepID=A0A0D4C0U9_9MICC|nr:hypothetical protein [Psychromicrobium lacuslunae]AJT42312.1 hypothetical protein UM93_13920 [Psychromicrobium lacuslunae]